MFRTRSGKMLFTNEHKASLSKEKSNTYIDIDELKVFKNYFYDRTSFKTEIKNITKTKDKTMLDKINNKISIINETSTILAEIRIKLKKKYKLIYELQDDLWLSKLN